MKLFILFISFISLGFAGEMDLGTFEARSVNIGTLNQDLSAPVELNLIFSRTSKTPEKVVLKYNFNFVDRACIDYEIKSKYVEPIKMIACEKKWGNYSCQKKEFPGYKENKRVCSERGYERLNENQELTFNFKRATPLAEGHSETFRITMEQKRMTSKGLDLTPVATRSSAVYDIKKLGKTIYFNLK